MSLTLLKEMIRVSQELKRKPTIHALKHFEYLKFMGADRCPECGDQLDLQQFRRLANGCRIQESISCDGCGARLELTDAAVN